MDQFNEQIYKKYTALKKQKLHDDELARKREADIKKLHDAMMDWIKNLEGKNEELRQKMLDMLDEHKKKQESFLQESREKDKEILRLNLLLAEYNSTADTLLESSVPCAKKTSESNTPVPLAKQTPSTTPVPLAKETPESNSKAKRLRLSKESIVPYNSTPEEEARELECSRSHMCAPGNGTEESASDHMFHILLESLTCMKISLNKTTEGFSFCACHENTGYSFTLTWLEQVKQWKYTVSSLGTLDGVAFSWMNQDIKFSMDMCHLFFQRISSLIKKS